MHLRHVYRMFFATAVVAGIGATIGSSTGQTVAPSSAAKSLPEIYRVLYRLAASPPLGKTIKSIVYPGCPEGTQKLWDILSNAPMARMFSPGQSRYGMAMAGVALRRRQRRHCHAPRILRTC